MIISFILINNSFLINWGSSTAGDSKKTLFPCSYTTDVITIPIRTPSSPAYYATNSSLLDGFIIYKSAGANSSFCYIAIGY